MGAWIACSSKKFRSKISTALVLLVSEKFNAKNPLPILSNWSDLRGADFSPQTKKKAQTGKYRTVIQMANIPFICMVGAQWMHPMLVVMLLLNNV